MTEYGIPYPVLYMNAISLGSIPWEFKEGKMGKYTYHDFEKAAAEIRAQMNIQPDTAIILGSGLGGLATEVENPLVLDYAQIPGWPISTVPGHSGRLIAGTLYGRPVFILQGRVHFYEGYSPDTVTFPVRVLTCLGVKNLIVTNAAGGLNKAYAAGDIMLITDQIALAGFSGGNPLCGANYDEIGPRFPDMSQAYDRQYCEFVREAAVKTGTTVWEGTYVWVSGPSYETPAEVRFLRLAGGDAVGMSTVPEVIAARHGGLRVLGISGITNQCSDDGEAQTTHQEVLESANLIGSKVIRILTEVIPRLQH